MSDFNIHLYEHNHSFHGCTEPYDNFHMPQEANYSSTVNWDTILTVPHFADETYVSAGYAESTNLYVEDQDNKEHTVFSTGLDADHQESGKYADELSTGLETETTYYNRTSYLDKEGNNICYQDEPLL
ncbi:hypothetical protein K439DRAFT_1616016 [Ramaria rubella]|nr:hypothetical protein K439DRAFT_1616016 [Ramaria rubella]